MKQGKIYNKLIVLALLGTILTYLGCSVFSALRSPLTTTAAIEYEAGEGLHTTGFVARDETVLTSPYAITVLSRSEGERIGNGEIVATGYNSADAQARQEQIETLEAQIEQLHYADSYHLDGTDSAALDNDILADLAEAAKYAVRRDMNSFENLSSEIKGLVLRGNTSDGDLASLKSRLTQLQGQLDSLKSQSGSDTSSISAQSSGYFSGTVDGYETVLTPARLRSLNVAEFNALEPAQASSGAFGRLIAGDTWYYLTVVPASYLDGLSVSDSVHVSFSHDFYGTLSMNIFRIGDDEGGQRVLVLSCSDYLRDATLLREQTADIVFRSYSGLRVPKDALRMDKDGASGVYIVESARAKWKPVNILYDNGESYVVEMDKSDTDNLWPGDEIIVNARDLFDGKVVR